MPHDHSPNWEPDPQKMGNWRSLFGPDRGGDRTPEAIPPTISEAPSDADELAIDLSVYKPWVLQRGRSRPAMMLEFRRFEPRSGLWSGWAIAYPNLIALEYTGSTMLSLDFGTKQILLKGSGLDRLAHSLQYGVVLTVQEYAAAVWLSKGIGPTIDHIQVIGSMARAL